MKVIFLDVDGVLTYNAYRNKETANIDLEKVALLKEICDRTGADIVISSSWRGTSNYTPECYDVLISILQASGLKVIGNTPYREVAGEREAFTLEELEEEEFDPEIGSAGEVRAWLEEHPEVSHFVILDDFDFQWEVYGYDTHWVQPSWFGNGGLKREHVEKAVEVLNGR